MKIYSQVINDKNPFIFAEGKLQSITINKVMWSPINGYMLYATVAGVSIARQYDDALPSLYASEEDFRNNKAITTYHPTRPNNVVTPNDICENTTLYYLGNKGVRDIEVSDMDYVADYINMTSYIGDEEVTYYYNKSYINQCEDIKVVDAEGNETISKSILSQLALSEAQKEAWDNFVNALSALRKANVSVICDDESQNLYPIGGDDWTIDWYQRDKDKMEEHIKKPTLDIEVLTRCIKATDSMCFSWWLCLNDSDDVTFYPRKKD